MRCIRKSTALLLVLAGLPLLTQCHEAAPVGRADLAVPPSIEGDPLGRDALALLPARFVGARPELAGRVVLLRWWTDGCPFCEHSLPALDAIGNVGSGSEAADLVRIGVYHPKPPRAVADADVLAAARRLGWTHAVAVDEDWSALKALWLDARPRAATSATFLLDRHGRVRFVHPGPELHPSTEAEHADCDRDFRALEVAVAALLAEPR